MQILQNRWENKGKNMSDITVLTPSYNRGELLKKLYKSLCSQKNKSFEWVIIDDGSTDKTENYVNYFYFAFLKVYAIILNYKVKNIIVFIN